MSAESQKSNPDLTQACELFESMKAGGINAPASFASLMQLLLTKTVMKEGSFLRLIGAGNNSYIVTGPRRSEGESNNMQPYKPLALLNGRYLYVHYDCFIDVQKDNFLKIVSTKIAYQHDEAGEQQYFRFDHNRYPDNQYPSSHLHVYGKWMHEGVKKDLHHVHFPVIRPTMEGVVRLLIHEFEVPTNTKDEIWKPILLHTETGFRDMMSKAIRTGDAPK